MNRRDKLAEGIAREILNARRDPVAYARTGRVEGGVHAQTYKAHVQWHNHLTQNKKAVIWAPIAHGKTTQLSRWRILWELGRNPNIRVAVISATQSLPTKILTSIKMDIDQSPWLHRIFPKLRRHPLVEKWGSASIMIDRGMISPDPTIQVFGLHGNILGSRLDLIVLDDVCNIANMLTPYSRQKVWEWISGEVLSRSPPDGSGRVWYFGHVWHKEDPGHKLAEIGYPVLKHSAWVDKEKGLVLIPELWTHEGLMERAKALGIYAPLMLDQEEPSDASDRIPIEWVMKCLRRGTGYKFVSQWHPGDAPTYTGVDLGIGKRKPSGRTAIFTIAVLPDGSRRVLDVRSGHWNGKTIIENLLDVHSRFGSIVGIENNGAQEFLVEFSKDLTAIPIKAHHTGMNKHSPEFGVESLGIEISNEKWIFPCDHNLVAPDELAEAINELRKYSPLQHAGDRVMAWWICREMARQSPITTSIQRDNSSIDTLAR